MCLKHVLVISKATVINSTVVDATKTSLENFVRIMNYTLVRWKKDSVKMKVFVTNHWDACVKKDTTE